MSILTRFFEKFLFCDSMPEMEIINQLQIFVNIGEWNTGQFYAELQHSFVSLVTLDGNILKNIFSTICLLQTWYLLDPFQFIIQMQIGATEFCMTYS